MSTLDVGGTIRAYRWVGLNFESDSTIRHHIREIGALGWLRNRHQMNLGPTFAR